MEQSPTTLVEGSFWFLFAFDVAEEIRLESIPRLTEREPARRETSLHRPTPDYVRFERPPVVEHLEPIRLASGDALQCELKSYDYGAISVKLEMPFRLSWPDLVKRSSQLLDAQEPKEHAVRIVQAYQKRIAPAIVRPREWLDEEYFVVHLKASSATAAALMESHSGDIAKIVRGEFAELSDAERDEILRSRISYYPQDLMVVAWAAAFVFDTAEGASADLQLLEYANTQLLEFRYYDHLLTDVLAKVYNYLGQKRGSFSRWGVAREARELNTILLDVRELTERADTAIKFLSDMFSARVYRLASERMGVTDYRRLVEGKLQTASQLYRSMMDQFHESRAFVLELMIVIILIIDLIYLFRGQS